MESDPDFTMCGIAFVVFALIFVWIVEKIKKIFL